MRVPLARSDRLAVPRQTVPIVVPDPTESTQHLISLVFWPSPALPILPACDHRVTTGRRRSNKVSAAKRENAMRNVFLAGIAFAALTTSAMAADMAPYYKAPPVAQGFNWNGFYLGA